MGTIAMMELKRHYSRTFEMSLSFKILRIRIGTFGAENFNGFRVISPSGTAKYKGIFSSRSQVQKQEYIFSFRQLLFDQF